MITNEYTCYVYNKNVVCALNNNFNRFTISCENFDWICTMAFYKDLTWRLGLSKRRTLLFKVDNGSATYYANSI